MEKQEIKKTVEDITKKTKTRIQQNPIAAFFVGLLLGFLIGNNREFFMPILGLTVVTGAILYFWLNAKDKN